jgi:hypothetical protein
MSDYIRTLSYENKTDKKLLLIVEPWAEQYWLPPGEKVDIVGQGGESGSDFQLNQSDGEIIVFGWIDSIVKVMRNGQEMVPSEQT